MYALCITPWNVLRNRLLLRLAAEAPSPRPLKKPFKDPCPFNVFESTFASTRVKRNKPAPSSALEPEMEEEKNAVDAEPASTEELSWILNLSDDSDVEL